MKLNEAIKHLKNAIKNPSTKTKATGITFCVVLKN